MRNVWWVMWDEWCVMSFSAPVNTEWEVFKLELQMTCPVIPAIDEERRRYEGCTCNKNMTGWKISPGLISEKRAYTPLPCFNREVLNWISDYITRWSAPAGEIITMAWTWLGILMNISHRMCANFCGNSWICFKIILPASFKIILPLSILPNKHVLFSAHTVIK